ncbi:hypothetical protein L2E82_30159 [Cichorium intybus]|uniref:Uncharacterized protein n=1 Tax=Cichorium intybus TaxID=13427 RepID=A0ACB9CZG3_CICIN|nr:hypothetical protein L2E82_30159 [Cichorium intybus]
MHGLYEDDNYLHMVMDLYDSPDLFDRISKHGGVFSELEAFSVFCPLISESEAFRHCHRDIKPDNVLFDSRGKLKLADFGLANWIGMNERRMMTGVVGTPYYVAPEVLSSREETPAEPFEAVRPSNLRFPARIFRSVSSEVKDLLRKMLRKDVSRRFSAEQVLRHPWVVSGGEARSMGDLT